MFTLTISISNAQQPNPMPDMNDSLAVLKWLKEKRIPALAFGYLENGEVKRIHVFGELRTGIPAPADAVFNVASITKTITAMVTLNLVNAGKWKLDEPLAHYFTDSDVKDDPRSGQLTTRDILTHRTGFPNWRSELPDGKLAFQFDPGTRYQYSGEGFEYLRHALERKFRRSLDQLADSIIFKPLGMADTRFTWNGADERRFAYPFDSDEKQLEVVRNTEPNSADLLKTTITDYCKFIAWVLNGAGLNKALFGEMASHQAVRKADSYMGLGWVVYDPVGKDECALSHGGHDPGVHTLAVVLPKSQRALVIFTNSDNGIKIYPDLLEYYLGAQGQAIVSIETKKTP
ncbi:MAG TPA: serine hydrolase domain-containing protein [Dyadobacter sp.]|nr:serine hydrolase domain-containing protein [Dyadobacter sp.]